MRRTVRHTSDGLANSDRFWTRDGLVLTSRNVMYEGWPVLLVVHHDDEHETWGFVNGSGDTEAAADAAMMVHVQHVLDLDPSIEQLADLPLGWQAWRESCEAEWLRGRAAVDAS